ncbi:possible ribulose-5-phosphate 4-epimerase and related epimerases [Aurantimonas manganoxydans SI85-9A1]|uniref:Possible ribulose-5-phosphate 4-epimerase and related epimerases n=1 Tax=Aurantimonas manganoxydans (strain ATCC BAA-1229 / DSM 21871 / SI85-9A1) TaxID=287752 RepID=Q1YKY5_AURMS|nr:class II aldolase/adducin family protein [Aurantimonas manganoxydans]EAS50388.1 possible ribulose-5-phosphate 4-epimerase and related epimerases [Aurantimonas manganoxydans SI85-9A1]
MSAEAIREKNVIEATLTTLVMANRILARETIIDNFGHVSVRHPLNPDRYFLSRSRSPEIVTRDDIMEFTLEGEQIGDDPRKPYAERHIHGAIYKDRPDVHAVTHHHARSVLPFTMCDASLRPMFHMASVIGAEIPVWDSQDEFGDTNMLVDSMAMGHSLSRALGANRVALLRGHGAICAATDLKSVVMISIGLRDNAELIQATRLLGAVTYLTDGEIDKASAMLLSPMPVARAWDYWTARAGFGGI